MSDRMGLIPFGRLMEWIFKEKKEQGTVFGVHKGFAANAAKTLPIFSEKIETPFGPAAGPNTQLAQNIVAAYYSGSRFFELKTVQILDGEDLPVNKPCILADDECYNCEWSTELRVPDAFDEYVKAWFALKVISKEFGLGSSDGFVFNMSVGYDLEGIKSEKIDRFIEGLKDARETAIFKECRQWLENHLDMFENVTRDDILAITPHICTSITLSTLHGCPPQEIERIASYLIEEKQLNTYIKCNPTLLGYEFARERMNAMGYDYVVFGDFHFKDDLQYGDAVPMIGRLLELAKSHGVEFGVKITNTFPVDVTRNELPSEEMYMSGRSLYPLSIALAAKLAKEFDGKLRISYSGGADYNNIDRIFAAGIWPITMATTVLKTGGYNRFEQIARKLSDMDYKAFDGVDPAAAQALSDEAVTDKHHVKALKPLPSRKFDRKVPLIDCFVAPCGEGCPIHQDIPAYVALAGQGKYLEALKVITEKNPLPFITGTICAHNCMSKCTRNFYEEPVNIRGVKLESAQGGFDALMEELGGQTAGGADESSAGACGGNAENAAETSGIGANMTLVAAGTVRAAVVGGGPAGLAAAYFLARAGAAVSLFEKRESLGGIVRHVIPEFRIGSGAIDKDEALVRAMGVDVHLNTEITGINDLKAQGFTHVVLAVGAGKPGLLRLEKGAAVNALEMMETLKKAPQDAALGKNVAVVGGGNSAMDAARAARRAKGVEHVYLVYRRTRRFMPADEEELLLAMEDGVEFKELLSPVAHENGVLLCEKMKLGAMDASGRQRPEGTGEIVEIPADTVLAAVGEQIDREFYERNGLSTDKKGYALVNEFTLESAVEHVYVIGDGLGGPATVVEAIRDGQKAATAILESAREAGVCVPSDADSVAAGGADTVSGGAASAKTGSGICAGAQRETSTPEADVIRRKGILAAEGDTAHESERCLDCGKICENCVDVCPNRANVAITVPGKKMAQIVHVDSMCNECGNCKSFCPYMSAPYKDKFTVFANEADFLDSENQGFFIVSEAPLTVRVRLGATVADYRVFDADCPLYKNIKDLIISIYRDYKYIL